MDKYPGQVIFALLTQLLCYMYVIPRTSALNGIQACKHLIETSISTEEIQFGRCFLGVEDGDSVMKLSEERGVVKFTKWPTDYWSCKDITRDLGDCRFQFQRGTGSCVIYSCQSTSQTTSTEMEIVSVTNTHEASPHSTKLQQGASSTKSTQQTSSATSPDSTQVNHVTTQLTSSAASPHSTHVNPVTTQQTSSAASPDSTQVNHVTAQQTTDPESCSADCVSPNYWCNKGKCECTLLYSRTTDNMCVPGCSHYSNDFEEVKTADITCLVKHKKKITYVSSQRACAEKCVKEEEFLCIYFEIDHSKCYLQMWGDRFMALNYQEQDEKCVHYTRKCDHKGCPVSCVPPLYICNDGRCECSLLSSRTTDGKCVQGCDSYSDQFSVQRSRRGNCLSRERHGYDYIESAELCRKKCLGETDYICAYFEIDKGRCVTNQWRSKYIDDKYSDDEKDCIHYRRHCSHPAGECDKCWLPKYRCKKGKCVCGYGYSWVTKMRTCVQACSRYTSTFTLQSSVKCQRRYDAVHRWKNALMCRILCLKEKKFVCGGFHVYKGNCYLQEWTHDKNDLDDWEDLDKCTQYRRNCKPSCEEGYSLTEDETQCVLSCTEYTDKFQKLPSYCFKHGDEIGEMSEKKCRIKCLHSEKKCSSYEIYKGVCYLINVLAASTWKYYERCVHYQRICRKP